MTVELIVGFSVGLGFIVPYLLLMNDVRKLTKWKREIEGKTEFGDWLLVSKQEWDDFRKYVYAFEWDHHDRLKKLERGGSNTVARLCRTNGNRGPDDV